MQNIIIELGGKSRRLRYDFNAIADIEAEAKTGIQILLSEERIGFNTMRLLLWAGVKHEERGLTVSKVGDMLQELIQSGGDITSPMGKIMEALEASGVWGKTEEGNEKTEAAN